MFDTRIMGLGILDAATGERLVDIRGLDSTVGTPMSSAGSIFVVEGHSLYALTSAVVRAARREAARS